MKARVISTGKIVEVKRDLGYLDHEYKTEEGERFASEELDFSGEPDYWTRLEHKYAGMAMQGLLNNNLLSSVLFKTGATHVDYINEVVKVAEEYAHALVEKMKEEK